MTKAYIIIALFTLLALSTSCFKEDDKVAPHQSGNSVKDMVTLGESYAHQVFYDLYDEEVKSTNHIEDWDLALDSEEKEWNIYLNGSRMMYACNSGQKEFASVDASLAQNMLFDPSNGDSTVIGKWWESSGDSVVSKNWVYIIDLGQDANYQQMGLVKIQIEGIANGYQIKSARIDGSGEQVQYLNKKSSHGEVYLSFANGQVDIAPEKNNWTLLFSKYSTLLWASDGTIHDYLVAGVLINPDDVLTAIDSVSTFEEIELKDTSNYKFSKQLDNIGYDWKYYDFDNNQYSVVGNRIYIIKDQHGLYYKLRFVDFYDPNGIKGSPQFEFVRL